MNYDETMALIDFLNRRMRPLRWHQWPNVTWAKMQRWAVTLAQHTQERE